MHIVRPRICSLGLIIAQSLGARVRTDIGRCGGLPLKRWARRTVISKRVDWSRRECAKRRRMGAETRRRVSKRRREHNKIEDGSKNEEGEVALL